MKKVNYILIIVFIFTTLIYAGDFKLIDNSRGQLVIKWENTKYTILDYNNEYVTVSFPGGAGTFGDGKPMLPSQQIFVEIPKEAEIYVDILRAHVKVDTILDKEIYPTQPCPTDTVGEENKPRKFVKDIKTYSSDKLFPGELVQIVKKGIMRGRYIALLRINPVQYVPRTKRLILYDEIQVRITYGLSRYSIADSDNAMDVIAQGVILNYKPGTRKYRDKKVDYLIITHDDYLAKANEYAQWKREEGFNTKVVPLSQITDLRSPSASQIKAEIKKYYPGVVYVLLIGDANQIPLVTEARRKVPSDLCYAMLEGNDYYPDVYIGRIPANTPQQAQIMIDKILFYEKTPDTGNWYKRLLLCGQFQHQWSQKNRAERLFCETAYVIYKNLKNMYTFPKQTIGTDSAGLGHSEYYFRKETYRHKIKDPNGMNCRMPDEWVANIVSNSIAKENTLAFWQQGAFLVQHRDHGGETLWGTPSVKKSDVLNLNNFPRLPVLFSINCLTGRIDYTEGDCFIEAALKNPNGGAVAAIGAVRVSYSWWNDTLCDGFYTCLFGADIYDCMRNEANPAPGQPAKSSRIGVILNYGKMYLTVNYPDNPWNSNNEEVEFYLFHCFGAPDMMIRTQPPTLLKVNYTRIISTKGGEVRVKVVDKKQRKPIYKAKVCLYQDEILYVGYTNKNGELNIKIAPKNRKPIKLTITGENLYPFQGYLNIK